MVNREFFKKRIVSVIMAAVMVLSVCTFTSMGKAQAATTPVSKHGRLSVKGADLVDSHGNKFQLRGISTHGINWDVGKPYVNKKAFKTLRDEWGANAVRLAMYTEEYNGYCSGGNQAELRKLVDKGVTYATELGMYAIVDWHILNDGNPNKNKSAAKKFFTTMAKKYKNNTNVIYEICNEPNGCSWKDIKSYATDIIKTIRKYDKKAIIIVGTPTWSQLGSDGTSNEVADNPIKGYKNIMYSLHFYTGEWAHNEYLPAKVTYARKKKLPIIVSEFGLSEASGDGTINKSKADTWLKLLDKYNISYFCWSISNKNESASLLKPTTTKTSGWKSSDLSATGKYIKKKYLARKKKLGKKA
jgi:endoglucanase